MAGHMDKCPGPIRKAPNMPEDVKCPACGKLVEMWSHDQSTACPACGKVFTREDLKGAKK